MRASRSARRLDGLRIGVVREYMDKKLFAKADEESIDLVERAIDDLRKLGATIVDPGPEGALFQACIARYAPELLQRGVRAPVPGAVSGRRGRRAGGDHIATLLDMARRSVARAGRTSRSATSAADSARRAKAST